MIRSLFSGRQSTFVAFSFSARDVGSGSCRRLQHALGAAAQSDPAILRRTGGEVISVIVIILTGLTLAFGETSGGFRRLIQIVFGLSIAFAASSFFLSFFSFGGGALV